MLQEAIAEMETLEESDRKLETSDLQEPASPQPSDSAEDTEIVDMQIREGRELEYLVVQKRVGGDNNTSWNAATSLRGSQWTSRLYEFWHKNRVQYRRREILEGAAFEDVEPGSFGRFVVRARLLDYRRLLYSTRDFEVCESEEDKDDSWITATSLDEKWNQPINIYLRRCRVAEH